MAGFFRRSPPGCAAFPPWGPVVSMAGGPWWSAEGRRASFSAVKAARTGPRAPPAGSWGTASAETLAGGGRAEGPPKGGDRAPVLRPQQLDVQTHAAACLTKSTQSLGIRGTGVVVWIVQNRHARR